MATKQKVSPLQWHELTPQPVVLVSGPEQFFADRAWKRVRELLRERDTQLEVHEFEASEYESGTLLTLASPSLFGEPRLIHARGAEKANDAFITEAKEYLLHADRDTTLVIRHGGGQKGRGLLDAIRKSPGIAIEVACPQVKPQDLPGIIKQEFHHIGHSVDPRAVTALTQAFPENLSELMSVVAQIAQTAQGSVTVEHVENITGGRVEANAFKIADAAIAGHAAQALLMLRQALNSGASPIPLLAAMNYKVRAMARVYGAHERSAQLAKNLGMQPWQVERAQRDIRGWSEQALAQLIVTAAKTELELKGGTRAPEYALEQYVLSIARRGK